MRDRGALASDVLRHPVAGVVRNLGGDPSDDCLAADVLSLLDMADAAAPDPHDAGETIRNLRERLDDAKRLAASLPDWLAADLRYVEPSGEDLDDILARADHKVEAAERVTAAMASRIPADQRRRKNAIRDRVARACADIFSERTGATTLTATPSADHRDAVSPFGGFVYDVFEALELMDTPTAWFRPADKAAKAFTAKHASK